MISVEKALTIIQGVTRFIGKTEVIPVDKALGRITSEDILAPFDLPPFKQSIMDGYAICLHRNPNYKLIGEIKAGDATSIKLQAGEAVRIFTGAKIPNTANAVVMQEKVTLVDAEIQLNHLPKEGEHIRLQGDQIKKGSLSLPKGFQLNPSAIALIKSFGISKVTVTALPKVTILVTGNELLEAESTLSDGKIYESNSSLLGTALQQKGIKPLKILKVEDSLPATEKALQELLPVSDLVLISGGISVGDYDFVGKALSQVGVTQHFYTVKQKPGKPLYFGSKKTTYVLGLPGNPASSLTCLYVYGFPLLDVLQGNSSLGLTRIELPIAQTIENPSGRALFLKARIQGREVTQLNLQNSAMVLSFANANALIYIPENTLKISKGGYVEVLLLP